MKTSIVLTLLMASKSATAGNENWSWVLSKTSQMWPYRSNYHIGQLSHGLSLIMYFICNNYCTNFPPFHHDMDRHSFCVTLCWTSTHYLLLNENRNIVMMIQSGNL